MKQRSDTVRFIVHARPEYAAIAMKAAIDACRMHPDSKLIGVVDRRSGVGFSIRKNYSRKLGRMTSITVVECESENSDRV